MLSHRASMQVILLRAGMEMGPLFIPQSEWTFIGTINTLSCCGCFEVNGSPQGRA